MLHRMLPFAALSIAIIVVAACEPGAGPFQPSPWAGFPPTFSESPYNQFRNQFQADLARYESDPASFMRRGASGLACEIPADAQKSFAAEGFVERPEHATPSWEKVQSTYGRQNFAPIIDQVSLQLLEGTCEDGTINGPATIRATFLRLTPGHSTTSYYVTKIELLETCTYQALRRVGECRRYEVLESQYAEAGTERGLRIVEGLPTERSFVADYGHYANNREAAPGVAFETTVAMAGHEANKTLARYSASNGRLRYDEYSGGGPAAVTFYRRNSDRVLHGPVIARGGLVVSCYDEGVEVIRAAGCVVE